MEPIDLPDDLMRMRSEDWHLQGITLGSSGIYGPGTLINVENRVWRYTLDLASLRAGEWERMRVILDELRGQFGRLRVHACAPKPRAIDLATATFDNAFTFDAGFIFSAPSTSGISVSEAAPAGATLIRVSNPNPSFFAAASFFSLPGDRLHRAAAIEGGLIRFNPPLRNAVNAGDPVEINRPTAQMRLDTDAASLIREPSNLTRPVQLPLTEAL